MDLLQFHEIIRMTDPDRIFAPGGAMEAMMEAKKAGKLRYVGFTGHKSPEIHLKMLATAKSHGFKFDTVQMPINVMDAHYDSIASTFSRVNPVWCRGAIKPGHCAIKPGQRVRSKVDRLVFARVFRSRSVAKAEENLRLRLFPCTLER
jgi:hypothetical protein